MSLRAYGDANACTVQFSLNSLPPNARGDFSFQINNNGTSPINWVGITKPAQQNVSIIGVTSNDWYGAAYPSEANFSYYSIPAGASDNQFSVTLDTPPNESPSADWTVQASQNNDGSNPFNCPGGTGLKISDGSGPTVSSVSVNAGSTSATISWVSDEPATSKINYGLTSGYGHSTNLDSTLRTDHSLTINGLSPNTGYHYQIFSADGAANSTNSTDNTFLTLSTSSSPTQATNTNGNAGSISIPSNLVSKEKIAPTVTITTKIDKASSFKQPPTISGQASDNEAILAIEYSTDGGKNWLPADNVRGLQTKAANFSFTPINLDEGNYKVLARAIDTSGNIAMSATLDIVIDRLPPLIGGSIISLGPQVLEPGDDGYIATLAGIDQKITLSAVGGAIDISLSYKDPDGKPNPRTFSLTQSSESGLWSGIVSFPAPGSYQLIANSIDGIGNKTIKNLNNFRVSAPAKVVSEAGKAVLAKTTVYYLEASSNSWVVWDGEPYGQHNPQPTNKDGSFKVFLPAGTYYLRVKGEGLVPINSSIFNLKSPGPFAATLKAVKRPGFLSKIIPELSTQKIGFANGAKASAPLKNDLIGTKLPETKLISVNNNQAFNPSSLLGRPSLLSFMSTWGPGTSEQLPILSKISKNKQINVVPIALQQNVAEIRAYQSISGNRLNWLTDLDGTTGLSFNIVGVPTHCFIDSDGVLRKVIPAVLTSQEILKNLSGLQ